MSATNLPPLVVLLNAKGDASEKVKQLADQVGGLGSTISRLGAGLGAMGAIATGLGIAGAAAVASGRMFADNAERLQNLGSVTGATVPQLQVIERAFQNMRLGPEAADRAMGRLAVAIGRGNPLLKELGITTRVPYQAMLQLAEAFAASDDPATKAAISVALMGRSGLETSGRLSGLGAEIKRVGGVMRETGGLLTPEDLLHADALKQQMDDLEVRWAALWLNLQRKALPAAELIGTALNEMLSKANWGATGKFAQMFALLPGVRNLAAMATGQSVEQFTADVHALAAEQLGGPEGGAKPKPRKLPKVGQVVIGFDEDGNPIYGSTQDKAAAARAAIQRQALAGFGAPEAVLRDSQLEEKRQKLLEQRNKALEQLFGAGAKEFARGTDVDLGLEPRGQFGLATSRVVDQQLRKGLATVQPGEMKRTLDDAAKSAGRMRESLVDASIVWGEFVQKTLSGSAIMTNLFGALYQGIESGLGTALDRLGDRTVSLSQRVLAVLAAIGQAIERLAIQLAATELFKLAISLIPGVGTFMKAGLSVLPKAGGVAESLAMTPARPAGVTNISVYTYDASTIVGALLSPDGPQRRAGERLRFLRGR